MTMHPGVVRGHHGPTAARFGPDTGHDIPVALELTNALRPLLERFGTTPGFHLVVFTVDETLWSRELAPLAGFYPSVFAGAPWWFLDAPDAIRRFRAAIGETAGFSRTAGFVDDTRAFCTIPARHDMSRRIDAGVLAQLVAEHRLDLDEALRDRCRPRDHPAEGRVQALRRQRSQMAEADGGWVGSSCGGTRAQVVDADRRLHGDLHAAARHHGGQRRAAGHAT